MTVYRLIKSGELPAARISKLVPPPRGRRRRLPRVPLQRRRVGAPAARPTGTLGGAMAARFDTITFLSDYGTGDEFVGVVKSVIRQIAPARHRRRPHPRDPRLRRAGRQPHAEPGGAVPVPGRGAGRGRPRRRHRAPGHRRRGRRRAELPRRPRQRAARRRRRHVRRRHRGRRAHQPRLPARRARAHLRRPRRVRARPPPTCAPGVPLADLGPPDRPAVAAARACCRSPARRTARSSPRCCGSTATATASSTSTPTRWPPSVRGCSSAGATTCAPPSGRPPTRASRPARSASSSTATGCCRSASASARPPTSSASPPAPRSSSSAPSDDDAPAGAPVTLTTKATHMRPGTTLVLGILLALILGAAALQLFFML